MNAIKQAIEALEWMNRKGGLGLDVHEQVDKTLAALRGMKPATDEEIAKCVGYPLSTREINAFRAAERYHGIGGKE